MLQAIDALPIDFRLVVILADLQEFSYKEIAEILDVPVGTVMSRLFRGRKALQRSLRDYAAGQGVVPAETPEAPEAAVDLARTAAAVRPDGPFQVVRWPDRGFPG